MTRTGAEIDAELRVLAATVRVRTRVRAEVKPPPFADVQLMQVEPASPPHSPRLKIATDVPAAALPLPPLMADPFAAVPGSMRRMAPHELMLLSREDLARRRADDDRRSRQAYAVLQAEERLQQRRLHEEREQQEKEKERKKTEAREERERQEAENARRRANAASPPPVPSPPPQPLELQLQPARLQVPDTTSGTTTSMSTGLFTGTGTSLPLPSLPFALLNLPLAPSAPAPGATGPSSSGVAPGVGLLGPLFAPSDVAASFERLAAAPPLGSLMPPPPADASGPSNVVLKPP